MGRTFYKQPNGLMTIFSSIVDAPIYYNVSKEDYIKIMLEEYKKQLEKDAKEIFDDEDPYYVRDFEEMKDEIIRNYEDRKEEFEQYLKDVGYEGSIYVRVTKNRASRMTSYVFKDTGDTYQVDENGDVISYGN